MATSTTVRDLAAPPARLGSALLKPGNILPAFVWCLFAFSQAMNSPFPPAPSTVLLVLLGTIAVVLFVVRRDANRVGNRLDTALALSGTFVVSFLKGPTIQDTHLLPTFIQLIALVGWVASLLALGRSFGIVPADRGLVRHGPYRYVRHPIYAFEFLFFVAYFVAVPTPRSAVIIAALFVLQISRIIREEHILQGYGEYKERVRWRILPGVW